MATGERWVLRHRNKDQGWLFNPVRCQAKHKSASEQGLACTALATGDGDTFHYPRP